MDGKTIQTEELPCHIPLEIKDLIITHLIDSYNHDPAYQWNNLRYITKRHKGFIEDKFEKYWLPQLVVTAHYTSDHAIDYVLDIVCQKGGVMTESTRRDVTVRFKTEPLEENIVRWWSCYGSSLSEMWATRTISKNPIVLRLGEKDSMLNEPLRGGYIINDTDLPDLMVDETGLEICFNWKKALDLLLAEEMQMRHIQDDMIELVVDKFRKSGAWPSEAEGFQKQLEVLIPELGIIQMERRIQVQKLRTSSANVSAGNLPAALRSLHPYKTRWDFTQAGFLRTSPPRFLEIVCFEEYMIFQMPQWRELDEKILIQLCAEEVSWRLVRQQEPDFWWQGNPDPDSKTRMENPLVQNWLKSVNDKRQKFLEENRWDIYTMYE